jgi:hypothetical protein
LLMGTQRRDEFIMAFIKLTMFNIKLYRLVTQDPTKVAYGDIVWISQIERESYLEFDKSITSFFEIREPTPRTQTSLRKAESKSENQSQKAFLDASNRGIQKQMEAIKEKARHIYFQQLINKDIRSSVGMWKIEAENITKGSILTPSSRIRIRNLT